MNRLKEKILNETGGVKGLIFLCVVVFSMVMFIFQFYPFAPAFTPSPTIRRSPEWSPETGQTVIKQTLRKDRYAELEETLRWEELNKKLDAVIEGINPRK